MRSIQVQLSLMSRLWWVSQVVCLWSFHYTWLSRLSCCVGWRLLSLHEGRRRWYRCRWRLTCVGIRGNVQNNGVDPMGPTGHPEGLWVVRVISHNTVWLIGSLLSRVVNWLTINTHERPPHRPTTRGLFLWNFGFLEFNTFRNCSNLLVTLLELTDRGGTRQGVREGPSCNYLCH